MPILGEAYVVIRAALGPLKTGLAAAKSAVTKAMSVITGTIRKMVSVSYKWIKRAMLAVSAAIMGSVYAFSKFQEQMANVSTMLDEQTMQYMPRYSKAVKKMAIEFGEGTATLSKGLYDILSASIAPAKALDVLAVSAKAAKAGMTTTAVAADAITTILNAYGLSADKASNISDILFATVKRGKLTFEELASSVGKVAATASVAGLSFEEVSAAIATMTRSGLNAFLATTALRSILSGFLKPMESAKKVAREMGLELNATTLRTIGLTGVLEKLKDASAEQLAQLIPNRRALAGMAAMVKNYRNQISDLTLMLNSAGLTQIAYEKMTRTLSHSLRRLKQSFVILATTIGGTLAPAFKLLTDITVESTGKAIEYLEKHKFEIMRWAAVVATRINFVRGVIQDFIVGAYKNWPQTWNFMKDAAVGQFDVIWKAFNLQMGTAIEIAIDLFTAFGKSLYHIFEKVFMDVGSSMVTWMFNAAQWVRARAFIAKEFAGDEYAMGFAKKDLQEHGPGYFGFELKEAKGIGSWGAVTKKIEGEFVPALTKAKAKLKEVQKSIVDMEKELATKLAGKVPKHTTDSIENRIKEMTEYEKSLLKKIDDMGKAGLISAVGGATRSIQGTGTGGPLGGTGGGLGFMGAKEAWREISLAINKRDTQKDLLQVNKQQLIELEEMNAGMSTVGAVV